MPSYSRGAPTRLKCIGTDTYLTLNADGKCTANAKEATDAQKWYFDSRGPGAAIHNKSNAHYLNFDDSEPYKRVICKEQGPSPQIFLFQDPPGSTDANQCMIAVWGNPDPNRVLDVRQGDRASGTDVILDKNHNGSNQIWLLEKAYGSD